ncbi:MAG TPA: hypothetical protein VHF02_03945 [Luteimonas sp.]|nr:hypothetical protein [Luteimonas sp.]
MGSDGSTAGGGGEDMFSAGCCTTSGSPGGWDGLQAAIIAVSINPVVIRVLWFIPILLYTHIPRNGVRDTFQIMAQSDSDTDFRVRDARMPRIDLAGVPHMSCSDGNIGTLGVALAVVLPW